MISAKLVRTLTGDDGTFGTLTIGALSLTTGELPDRGNAEGLSSIPAGTYICKRVMSPKFGWVYEITNVPGRTHVLIHSGNFCGDKSKGFKSDVEGCVLVGQLLGKIDGQEAVTSSQAALRAFHSYAGDEDIQLTITDGWKETGEPLAGIA